MTDRDLPAALAVQSECYGRAMVEPGEIVMGRLRAFPRTAWIAEDAGVVCGYLVAYESRVGKVTPLGGRFERSAEADSLYLHDLAVSPRAKGKGAARRLLEQAFAHAGDAGLRYSSLVSVQDSQAFWRSFGYQPWAALDEAPRLALLSYGREARYMVMTMAAPRP